jgi:DNA-binding transcriptional MerR regulator
MRLKQLYSSREVAAMTGLTARQLQWWDSKRLFSAAVASHRTEAGGYTERRYTPLDVLELQTLADLRARGFSVPRLRHLLQSLRDVFGVRLYEAIGEGGPMTLFIGGEELYARTASGQLFNLARPAEPLLMVGEAFVLRPLTAARERKRRAGAGRGATTAPEGAAGVARDATPRPTRSEKSSRGRRPAGR